MSVRRDSEAKRCTAPAAFCIFLVLAMIVLTLVQGTGRGGGDEDITLVFTGDIMLGRDVQEQIDEHDDLYHPFRGIGEYTRKGDITFGNLENCVSFNGTPERKVYTFRSRPETLQGLKDAGFDIVSLANNHVCDFGGQATIDTMYHLEQYGINHTGLWYLGQKAPNASIPRPVVLEAKGVRFAFLCYGENLSYESAATSEKPGPVPTCREDVIKADIEYARSLADVVIVSIHWCRLPQYIFEADQGQIELCHRIADWGADIQVHHGPHALQEIEVYNGSLIMYSLGNTVFDLNREESHRSFIALVRMRGTEPKKLELVPIVKNEYEQYIPRGDILKADITNDLFLDWDDYESGMFESDDPLTDYERPPLGLLDILLMPETWVMILAAVILVMILVFAVSVARGRRKRG